MDKESVKKAILEAAGNPSVGVIAEYADRMAEAVINLGKPNPVRYKDKLTDTKETRVIDSRETR